MRITVAICTWNREKMLDRTLAAMRALEVPPGIEWELLVVDNNSTDGTQAVLARHRDALPLRTVFECRPGKSHALNRVNACAAGELVLYTDDDVFVSSSWLSAYAEAARRWPSAGFFGGPIVPRFEPEMPRWLAESRDQVSHVYGLRDFGDESFAITPGRVPFGANYAVRSEFLHYRYDTRLGVRAGSHLGGEETELMCRLLADGIEGRWVPGAGMEHFVPQRDQTLAHVRRWALGMGTYYGMTDREDYPRSVFGCPLWALRGAVEGELRFRIGRLLSTPPRWIGDLLRSSLCRGYLRGHRAKRSAHK